MKKEAEIYQMVTNTPKDEIARVFNLMMAEVRWSLDKAYNKNIIDAELYAATIAKAVQPVMKITSQIVTQQPVIDGQEAKSKADIEFVKIQKLSLTFSVHENTKIKTLNSYSDLMGSLGSGGLRITDSMFAAYYSMLKDLNDAVGLLGEIEVEALKGEDAPARTP
jgi:hypothetical protein